MWNKKNQKIMEDSINLSNIISKGSKRPKEHILFSSFNEAPLNLIFPSKSKSTFLEIEFVFKINSPIL